MTSIRIHATGAQLLVQDAGRPGRLALGIAPAGFMDVRSARLANRLVGNDPDAALLESLLGGVEVEALDAPVWCAVTGAAESIALLRGDMPLPSPANSPLHLEPGMRLRVEAPARGMRAYLAVRGGIDLPAVLGSQSTDTMSGIGPEPVGVGDVLPIGRASQAFPHLDIAPVRPLPREGEVLRIPISAGPREEWLADHRSLTVRDWIVGSRQDRIGIRLEGEPVALQRSASLPSEGTVAGAIEVPPDGLPYVLMRDHPVTVGYPVVAVVAPEGLDALAQARPGCIVRFVRR